MCCAIGHTESRSYQGFCDLVRGKLSCISGVWLLLIPWSLLQERRVTFSFLFCCSEVTSPELACPCNFFCSGYILWHFSCYPDPSGNPPMKSNLLCVVFWQFLLKTMCWGVDVPASLVTSMKNRINTAFPAENPLPAASFYASYLVPQHFLVDNTG